MTSKDLQQLKQQVQEWGLELGFQQIAVSDIDLSEHTPRFQHWLAQGFYGDMDWITRNTEKRAHPEQLHEGTVRVITARMDYRPDAIPLIPEAQNDQAQISCYATGRDYHKIMRKRLTQLADKINQVAPEQYRLANHQRAFVDSAPVLERALAEKSGLGWIGKNTLLINKQAGSWFFLGELFTNIPLPIDEQTIDNNSFDNSNHCGSCTACIDACPTQAIVAPNQVDARKCISYLTIEHKGSIPENLRPLMGNRIFGCDDCQIVCPWNKFSQATNEKDFSPRAFAQGKALAKLFLWSEAEFLKQTEGTPIRRLGYERWLRNIAVALGNAKPSTQNIQALQQRKTFDSDLVKEHVEWALLSLTKN